MNQSAALSADSFIKDTYYTSLDQRSDTFPSLFSPLSKIIWNGTSFDAPAYHQYISTLPSSTHTIHSYDAHPSCDEDIVIMISGVVTFAGGKERIFSGLGRGLMWVESIVLHGEGGMFLVESICFRFV
jgi:hypothetical protein